MATSQSQNSFNSLLESTGEVGLVTGIFHSIATAQGLPGAHLDEVVLFENGSIGQIFSLEPEKVEILLLKAAGILVGSRVVRTGKMLNISVGDGILGKTINPLVTDGTMPINKAPLGLIGRKPVEIFFETGVSLVDLIVPLGKGQRELVIGDRKTGKTEFLMQSVISHTQGGGICVYAIIGQRQIDILKRAEFFKAKGITDKCVIVATNPQDSPGLIFLTPYTAMTVAEYFRDKGMDVLVVLDDMTSHARYYREVSLLARRFPAKESYPGDIFYAQARIIERAGNFEKGSITCIPVAESVAGDLSGYIQTNLMSMTDGHLYFDGELYNQGRRPSVNPLLSVTRVGHQTQTPLMRDVGSVLSSFLVKYEKMKQYRHFGAEAGELVKEVLVIGSKLDAFFNQAEYRIVPINVDLLVIASIWANVVDNIDMERIFETYKTDASYKKKVDDVLSRAVNFDKLVRLVKENPNLCLSKTK